MLKANSTTTILSVIMLAINLDECMLLPFFVDNGLNLLGDNTNMTDEGAGHNEDTFSQHEHNTLMVDGDDGMELGEQVEWNRGVNMGHGLQRLTRAQCSKLPIVIAEGKIRPAVPILAAKWATECNIAVRNHIPVFKHWKEYKKLPEWIKTFMGILSAKFDVDTRDPTIKKACIEMMKLAVRQQRYKLKKEFFDPFPLHLVMKTSPVHSMSDKQWIDLVESWKTPKRWEISTMVMNLMHLICLRTATTARK